jgi:hypothetical protein
VDRVAAASGHIDALAKAAKHAGDRRPVDHIRADLFLGMTDGSYTGLDDAAILAHRRTTHANEDGPDDEGNNDDGNNGDDGGELDDGNGPDDGNGAAEGGCSTPDDLAQRGPAGAGMELRVQLSTRLGGDEYPAEPARELAATLGGGAWCSVITDEQGQLSHCGITRARPTGTPTRRAGCRAPARTADTDHTHDPDHGGPTTDDNLGHACRHDHRLKHQGGWQLQQLQAGHFHWTSRLGHSYHRRPPLILEPLPDPLAPDRPPVPPLIPADTDWEGSQIRAQLPEPEPEPQPPSEPDYRDDIPPF